MFLCDDNRTAFTSLVSDFEIKFHMCLITSIDMWMQLRKISTLAVIYCTIRIVWLDRLLPTCMSQSRRVLTIGGNIL